MFGNIFSSNNLRLPIFIGLPYKIGYFMIRKNITDLVIIHDCININHLKNKIAAICLEPECNESSRILCTKCILEQEHLQHTKSFALFEECLWNDKEVYKLLHFFALFHNNKIQDPEGQVLWLYNTIVLGRKEELPIVDFDEIVSTVQSQLYNNFSCIKDRLYQDWEKSQKSLSNQHFAQAKKIQNFKKGVEEIIQQSNKLINEKFNQLFQDDTQKPPLLQQQFQLDSLEFSSTINQQNLKNDQNQMPQNLSGLLLNFKSSVDDIRKSPDITMKIEENSEKHILDSMKQLEKRNSTATSSKSIKVKEPIPTLPCFSFIEKIKPPSKKISFRKQPQTQFSEGGKLITIIPQSTIISNVSFNPGYFEMRIKIQSDIKECLHIGVVTHNMIDSVDYENQGMWCCLNPQKCKYAQKMIIQLEFNKIMQEQVVALNLNYNIDEVSLKLWTYKQILPLYIKQGYLNGQKQYFFIKSYDTITLELLN